MGERREDEACGQTRWRRETERRRNAGLGKPSTDSEDPVLVPF